MQYAARAEFVATVALLYAYTDCMADQTTLLAWACVALGAYLAGFALNSMRTGETRGYYRDHRYRREEAGSDFNRWVWGRLILGGACLLTGYGFLP